MRNNQACWRRRAGDFTGKRTCGADEESVGRSTAGEVLHGVKSDAIERAGIRAGNIPNVGHVSPDKRIGAVAAREIDRGGERYYFAADSGGADLQRIVASQSVDMNDAAGQEGTQGDRLILGGGIADRD